MTLFLLEGLITSKPFDINVIKSQYKKFLITQIYDFEDLEDLEVLSSLDSLFEG